MDPTFDLLASQFPPSSPSGSQSAAAAAVDAEIGSVPPDSGATLAGAGGEAPLSHYQGDENFRYEGTEARRSAAGKAAMVNNASLTWEEKKNRQRDQNRLAAERSRAKKRKQQGNLESIVGDLENENARMRERIAEIKGAGAANGQPPPSISTANGAISTPVSTTSRDSISADNAYLKKVFRDLTALKATLLEKECELSNARGHTVPPENKVQLQALLERKGDLFKLESELATFRLLTDNLISEREEMAQQREHLGALPALGNDGSHVGHEIDLAPWVHAAVRSIERSHVDQENTIDPAIE